MNSLADDEGLRQTLGLGLHGVAQIDAPALAVAEQIGEARRVLAAWR